jgi:hypothetical protein
MDLILIELILVSTIALGIGFWQLYDVNKELKKSREESPEKHRQSDDDGAES